MTACAVDWCTTVHDDLVIGQNCHQRELLSADLGLLEPVTTWLSYLDDVKVLTVDVEGLPTVPSLQPGEALALAELLRGSVDAAEALTGPETGV